METDTMAAITATLVGTVCLSVAAAGVIALCIAPLGETAVVVASAATGLAVAVLLVGGFSAWRIDRRGSSV